VSVAKQPKGLIDVMISRWGSGDTRDDGLDKLKASLSYEIKLKKAMEINNY
jgi:hypothetical protein